MNDLRPLWTGYSCFCLCVLLLLIKISFFFDQCCCNFVGILTQIPFRFLVDMMLHGTGYSLQYISQYIGLNQALTKLNWT